MKNIVRIVVFVILPLVVLATAGPASAAQPPVRIGYFANITHAQALYGRSTGLLEKRLGAPVDWKIFNAGPSAMEALLAGALDICYVGPNPAVNAYLRTKGKSLRIIAGAASGGVALVVAPHETIRSPQDFKGKRLASPEFGNTQDIALKSWLKGEKLLPGRDVQVIPTKNPDILTLFKQKQIAGAWVPEPWLTRLVREAQGQIFVDERTLWEGGRFPTALVVVRAEFLAANPELVKRFLDGHVEATLAINKSLKKAAKVINDELIRTARTPLPQSVIDEALTRLTLTYDPTFPALLTMARRAADLGMLPDKPAAIAEKLAAIVDARPLNGVLQSRKLKPVPQ